MSAIATRFVRPLRPVMLGQRSFCVSARHSEQNPRSKLSSESPMSQKSQNQSYVIGGVGLALGLGFFYLMTRPEKAKDQPIEGVKTKIASTK
ncbi:hypothetical protein MRS44_006735 [Fusarium solani]|uniref:Uncharacterized protein n=1 Tax=Fusarium solani TaxID=169388 RepID=A0A9P9RCY8_FUSSL|nr:uncharacterized protein B0J15DRAFT_540083 [Fusarium solani]KAH7275031.1 hypothetical protein B0J15DRAFT_540083 [Fusarium solani]KAJ3466077.1 hypothetical protein MRS44_006735 [Fusarium solani]